MARLDDLFAEADKILADTKAKTEEIKQDIEKLGIMRAEAYSNLVCVKLLYAGMENHYNALQEIKGN